MPNRKHVDLRDYGKNHWVNRSPRQITFLEESLIAKAIEVQEEIQQSMHHETLTSVNFLDVFNIVKRVVTKEKGKLLRLQTEYQNLLQAVIQERADRENL